MKYLNLNLKSARNLCQAIIYANEQVRVSDVPVYTKDTNSDEAAELNKACSYATCDIAHQLLGMFSDSIDVEVQPSCISSNREAGYVFETRRNYMFSKLSNKVEVVYEDDDTAKLIYHR